YTGSQAEMLCEVRGVRSSTKTVPLVADVAVELIGPGEKTRPVFSGKTDAAGQARVRFSVPELPSGQYRLQVRTPSVLGTETRAHPVKLQSAPKLLLTTDKPLYQPGQTIHLRALALRAFDLAPAGKAGILFEVEDAKGNKVFKKEMTTSEYGIAST